MIAGERILIDRKFRDPVSVHVRGKWLVLGNQLPVITDHSVGFWRRWDVVPFNVVIAEHARDPLLARPLNLSHPVCRACFARSNVPFSTDGRLRRKTNAWQHTSACIH